MSIRRTRRSKLYIAPVLLDHASIKRLLVSMVLVLVVVFLSGYVAGFKKAEVRLASYVEIQSLELPETVVEVPASMEPVTPLKVEPGEMIDVDVADAASTVINRPELNRQVAQIESEQVEPITSLIEENKVVPKPVQEIVATNAVPELTHPSAVGGPAATDPEQSEALLIQDTANEETASYTIQVGMYGQLENAEQRLEELVATDLSAYLTDYMNKKNEIRYNVRFGYFADRKSARKALAAFEKEFSGSAYIVHMPSLTNVSANVAENSDG